jgi:hypothetical protein
MLPIACTSLHAAVDKRIQAEVLRLADLAQRRRGARIVPLHPC